MKLTEAIMLDRFLARDETYDGRFLAGVATTGIYCLPSCRARKPLAENIRFYRTPAEAEAAGLRPCRRCRPDLFHLRRDPEREALSQAVAKAWEAPEIFPTVHALARALPMSQTQLNEAFHRHYHRSAGLFLTEARVDKAKRLLKTARDSVVDIGAASGYETLSSFNANFRRLTGLCPSDYRALACRQSFTLALPGRRVLDSLRVQGRDSRSLCEHFEGNTLAKAVMFGDEPAVLELTATGDSVHCRAIAPGAGKIDMYTAHAMTLRLLGLAPDPAPFERMAARHALLSPLIERRRGLLIPQTADIFEGLTWAIIGQQINLSFAFELRRRLVRLTGRALAGGLFVHPAPPAVAALDYSDLERLSFSRRKAEYLVDLARSVVDGSLVLESRPALTAAEIQENLLRFRGIGVWTSNYLGMRSYGFADCAPLGDTGLAAGLQALLRLPGRPNAAEAERLLEEYRPFRSFVTFHLWQTMGGGA